MFATLRPRHRVEVGGLYRALAARLGWEWFDTYDGGEWRRQPAYQPVTSPGSAPPWPGEDVVKPGVPRAVGPAPL